MPVPGEVARTERALSSGFVVGAADAQSRAEKASRREKSCMSDCYEPRWLRSRLARGNRWSSSMQLVDISSAERRLKCLVAKLIVVVSVLMTRILHSNVFKFKFVLRLAYAWHGA